MTGSKSWRKTTDSDQEEIEKIETNGSGSVVPATPPFCDEGAFRGFPIVTKNRIEVASGIGNPYSIKRIRAALKMGAMEVDSMSSLSDSELGLGALQSRDGRQRVVQ